MDKLHLKIGQIWTFQHQYWFEIAELTHIIENALHFNSLFAINFIKGEVLRDKLTSRFNWDKAGFIKEFGEGKRHLTSELEKALYL